MALFCVKNERNSSHRKVPFPVKAFPSKTGKDVFTQKSAISAPADGPFKMQDKGEDELIEHTNIKVIDLKIIMSTLTQDGTQIMETPSADINQQEKDWQNRETNR